MAVNLWPNADFESGIADWNISNLATIAHSSTRAWEQSYSLEIDTGGWVYSGAVSDETDAFDVSTQYTWSCYIWVNDPNVILRFAIEDQDDNSITSDNYDTATAGEWVRYSLTGTTGVDDTGIKARIIQMASEIDTMIYVDGFMMETGASASAWVNYISGTDIAVGNVGNSSIAAVTPITVAAATAFTVGNVGNSSIAGYNPNTTIGTGLWEVGAYIYDVIGEIHVNVGNVGAVGVDGFNPATLSADTTFTVGNVGGVSIASPDPTITFNQITSVVNVGAVAIAGLAASVLQAIAFTVTNVGRVVIAGLNADVAEGLSSAASGITRIAMKMATILRR